MSVSTFTQPDYTAQSGAAYKGNLDGAADVLKRLAASFAPHAQSSADMTVRLDAGAIFDGMTLTEVAAQSTGAITAPSTNPRIDRLVVDQLTGVVSVITGTEDASPTAPAITAGKAPVARVSLVVSQSSIVNADITDERQLGMLGLGAAANATDIPNAEDVQTGEIVYAADAGSTDAYAISLTPAPSAYTTGMVVNFKANTVNTGAATLNVNSLGAKTIKKLHDTDLDDGDIEAGQFVSVIYDGTNFQMQSQTATSGGGVFESALLHVQDEKTLGTHGGAFTSGAWRTRDLNTVKTNEITGASLSANQISLPAGTYWIKASAPALEVGNHQTRVQDITNTVTLAVGRSESNATAGNVVTRSFCARRFTLSGTASIELQHRCQATRATAGLGVAGSFTTEVYGVVEIWKVS